LRRSPARGRWAEAAAARYLTRTRGYHLEARNVRLAGGEIDLVLRDGETWVFVEVKSREAGTAAAARAVTADKRRRLGRAAAMWLARHGVPAGGCRFDVVTVGAPGPEPVIEHYRAAFEAPQRWGL
jgi:putative endonuclease